MGSSRAGGGAEAAYDSEVLSTATLSRSASLDPEIDERLSPAASLICAVSVFFAVSVGAMSAFFPFAPDTLLGFVPESVSTPKRCGCVSPRASSRLAPARGAGHLRAARAPAARIATGSCVPPSPSREDAWCGQGDGTSGGLVARGKEGGWETVAPRPALRRA